MRILLATLLLASAVRAEEIDVAAAASLQDALRVVARTYEARHADRVTFDFAGSNVLARQIRAGAPVDIFLSADEPTMNSVARFLAPGTRRSLLSNELVVVAPHPLRSIRDLLQVQRIAIANPSAVPAGVYARQYLERIGLWSALAPKVIPTANVRAALAAVEGGNVDAAFVYRTDALLAKRCSVAFAVRGREAPVVSYPVAILSDARHPAAARRFLEFIESPEGLAIFRRFGFVTR